MHPNYTNRYLFTLYSYFTGPTWAVPRHAQGGRADRRALGSPAPIGLLALGRKNGSIHGRACRLSTCGVMEHLSGMIAGSPLSKHPERRALRISAYKGTTRFSPYSSCCANVGGRRMTW